MHDKNITLKYFLVLVMGGLLLLTARCKPIPSGTDSGIVEFKVRKGDTVNLILANKSGSGYIWSLEDSLDDKLLLLGKKKIASPQDKEEIVSTDSVQWQFKTVEKGKYEFKMSLARPWDKANTGLEQKTVRISVK